MKRQISELLTQYGPIAAIGLDRIAVPLSGDPSAFHCEELYDHIHHLQPQVLISHKQGLLGSEDFFAPEHTVWGEGDPSAQRGRIASGGARTIEVCTTMCPGRWGYLREKAGQHLTAEQVWAKLGEAVAGGYNLLLNTGPLPDGSLDPEDVDVLRKVGARLRAEGFPSG